jgi:hypothetical protein
MRQDSIGTCHKFLLKKKFDENSSIITETDIRNSVIIMHRQEHDQQVNMFINSYCIVSRHVDFTGKFQKNIRN